MKQRLGSSFCLFCEKEICESCMFGWATCKDGAKTRYLEELKEKFNEEYA